MKNIPFSLIFLAGGTGTRMKSEIPKQFLKLGDKAIALHSFELFLMLPEIVERVIVCETQYRSLFSKSAGATPLQFAMPGERRQDSVFNGLHKVKNGGLICIHDSARPFITINSVREVVHEAEKWGSAALGVPLKATVKICDENRFVLETPLRRHLWEMQTPQVVRKDILQQGFEKALNTNLTITDDVSLSELNAHPVKIVESSYTNIKITTPEDRLLAEQLLQNHVQL